MVHYAYIKNINDDWSWRYVIVFASRTVADEWWRAVSTSTNTKYSDSVRRVTSQFFTHDINQANAAYSINDAQVASRFLGKVFFTLLPERDDGRVLSVIPSSDFADHVSGNTFFIRSKVSPNEYWYCPGSSTGNVTPNSKIYVSRTERTRFRVRLMSERKDATGTIMIGSDEIAITLTSAKLSVRVSRSCHLIISKSPEPGLKLSDLVNGFGVVTPLLESDPESEDLKELFKTDDGEEWELV
ncbi:uncharacterized protein EDB91DRAFT_1077399 [Suillus paluster]|uniref:uncharacterized protein n=1 Tax=Suillus paluster TaxID=48578 RepID=UPI001B874DC0|nr:uncharacterized protein EDB91DRAFT_1077399 [Suillus paluster]KAG1753678.1 hypothetical protein EDB91DRAFT_1077399 [Suillus paluster]